MFNQLFSSDIRKKILQSTTGRKLILKLTSGVTDEYKLLSFSRSFDSEFYLRQYPDVAEANVDPLIHFIQFGCEELRNPNDWFDTRRFIENNQIDDRFKNALLHYLILGGTLNASKKNAYEVWVDRYDTLTEENINRMKVRINQLGYQPLISVLMPVYNTNLKFLRKAIDSVINQIYTNWELCIADDNSSDSKIKPFLEEYAKNDDRIKLIFRSENGHISEASNSALTICSGEFIALLDHDDELAIEALYMVVESLNEDKSADILFSDEDKITEDNRRFDPYFKSDWNKDLFYGHNCISHLGVYRTSLIKDIGGFRQGYEGSQDYDLALRCVENINDQNRIVHIPHILYHWRAIEGSTSLHIGEKNYAVNAGLKSLNSHLARINANASAEVVYGSQYRVKWNLDKVRPLVSIIIPFKDQVELLEVCLEGILNRTNYQNFEVILINNNSEESVTEEFLERIQSHDKIKILSFAGSFNYSAINNFGVTQCQGEIIALVNNDVKVIAPDWLEEMVSQTMRSEIGAVGAKLYYEDNTIQHAGVVLGIHGVAGHIHKDIPKDNLGYFARAALTQNLSAVTAACLLVRREVFEKVGGLDDQNLEVAFNDIDLCLRIREMGYSILFTPFAELYHYESKSRGSDMAPDKIERFKKEIAYMKDKWSEKLEHDPYYNLNLSLDSHDFSLSFPPRVVKPYLDIADYE